MVLKELCALRGVSGDEKRVRDYILERVKPFATETKIDRAGNLIAFRRGTGENRRHVALAWKRSARCSPAAERTPARFSRRTRAFRAAFCRSRADMCIPRAR